MVPVPTFVRPALGVYALTGVALWPVPLFNVLHVESSAVIAGVAFFVAGLTSLRAFREGRALRHVLGVHLAALAVPWALLTVTLVWAPNCGYPLGLALFVLFAGVTVVLAVCMASLIDAARLRRPRLTLVGGGLLVVVLGPLYDLGLHPQFYTYNHVFGGVLGPLYDEELALRPGLFWFRGLTLLWALLAALWARRLRGARDAATRRGIAAAALLVALVYALAAPLGLNTPAWYLQRALGGHVRTAHFDLYFDPDALAPDAVRRLALDHEYEYRRLARRLDVEVPERIASYLYPSPEAKAALTGARLTAVAPVWLARPQSHVLLEHYDRSFAHELVHVFSRRFGLPVVNASVSVGLVEGLAVALEPPDGRPGPHAQVIAAALAATPPGAEPPLAEHLAARLSPFGFWTGRGAVSYTTMGSFVRYLMDRYGAAPLREVYAWADFDRVYGRPVEELAEEWETFLMRLPVVPRDAGPLARARFARPSLFETRCPHYVPRYRRHRRRADRALTAGDTLAARRHVRAALEAWPAYPAALALWARLELARGRSAPVIERLGPPSATREVPALAVRLADAYALAGRADSARALFRRARRALPLYASDTRVRLLLREAVAARPDLVATLVGPDSAAARAGRLERLATDEPAVTAWRGLLLAEAERPAEAAALIGTALPQVAAGRDAAERRLLEVQRLVWLAELAYLDGRAARAARYARAAADHSARQGALDRAEHLAYAAERYAWLARRSEGTLSNPD